MEKHQISQDRDWQESYVKKSQENQEMGIELGDDNDQIYGVCEK